MSENLYWLAKKFADDQMRPEIFVGKFMDGWRRERDSGEFVLDLPPLSELLSSIFCMCDMFNSDPGREDYEFDEQRLQEEVRNSIKGMEL